MRNRNNAEITQTQIKSYVYLTKG